MAKTPKSILPEVQVNKLYIASKIKLGTKKNVH